MKIEYDHNGRTIYKFSHSVVQGGYLYAHKSRELITNKIRLHEALDTVIEKFSLINATIKIYDHIFFLFFMTKPATKPEELIQTIQETITQFSDWNNEYVYTTIYDLKEQDINKYLTDCGFQYEKGL